MIKKHLLILLLTISLGGVSYSQDPHFSQYYANPLFLNPAFAGTAVCPRLIMNYRNQWPSIAGTYTTYSASYDQHIEGLSGGIGVMFSADKAGEGTLNTNMLSLLYSYKLSVNRFFSIRAALQGTIFQKKLDWEKLTFGDQIDPKYGFIWNTQERQPDELTKYTPDFSAGILAYGESIYGGFAVHHMTEPNEGYFTISKLPAKYTFHLGGIIDLQHRRKRRKITDPTISPNILYVKQKDFEEMNYGLYFTRYPMVGGVWFRQNFYNADAFIVLLGFQTNSFKFGYSYDLTVSKLSNATAGAHEFSVALQFDCKPKKKRIRAINCPSF
ncbi:MAG: type IX secretion system membrane protein PorP/SprF [Bacteroidetes bacterium]|nr:type IX secretion system membrane protein PorP/SprF [Bacteroidota bacterium]